MYSALAVARHDRRTPTPRSSRWGPGIVGTATRLGFSGIEVGPVLDAAAGLGGAPIACLRVSFADPRARHRGVSHHSAHRARRSRRASRVHDPAPDASAASEEARLRADLADVRASTERHELVDVAPGRHRRRCSRRTTCTSCRWAGPPPTTRCCSSGRGRGRCAAAAGRVPVACRPCPTLPVAVERVLNLLALLLDTRVPLHARRDRARGRRLSRRRSTANRRAFERDKEILRGMGVPITTETIGDGERGRLPRPTRRLLPARPRPRRRGDRGAARRGERGLARQPARARARS